MFSVCVCTYGCGESKDAIGGRAVAGGGGGALELREAFVERRGVADRARVHAEHARAQRHDMPERRVLF